MDSNDKHLRTDEDLEAILRLAVQSPADSRELRQRLADSAAELGVTPEQLAHAEETYARQKAVEGEQAHERAEQRRSRVRRLKGLVAHLVPFVMVNAMLHAINFKSGFDNYWAIWPLLGWGIGVASHSIQVLFNLGDDEDEEDEEEGEGKTRRSLRSEVREHVRRQLEIELRKERRGRD